MIRYINKHIYKMYEAISTTIVVHRCLICVIVHVYLKFTVYILSNLPQSAILHLVQPQLVSELTIYNLYIKLVLVQLRNISNNNNVENTGYAGIYKYIYLCVCVCKPSKYILTIPGSTSRGPGSMSHGLQLPEMIGLVVGVLLVIVTVTIALVAVLVVILSMFITQTK